MTHPPFPPRIDAAVRGPIPAQAGIGLRFPHVAQFLDERPDIAWLEVHSENYLSPGGPRVRSLDAIRANYPISCHGVGLSLGSAEGLDEAHLVRLKALFDRIEPNLISEHVSWSVAGGVYLNDLLPLPYTEEALAVLCRNIERAQACFGRPILIENPSTYLRFAQSTIPEWEFLSEAVRRTGCKLLLDVNNIHVSAHNVGFDPARYLAGIAPADVGEVHLAGHLRKEIDGQPILIDDHGSRVAPAVWQLYERALGRVGRVPTLIEWDTDVPELAVLLDEAALAQARMKINWPDPEPVHAA